MPGRSLSELVKDAVTASRVPVTTEFDPSAVVVCPPLWIHLLEERVLAELQPEIEKGHCIQVSAEALMFQFWEEAKAKGDPVGDTNPRTANRLLSYEEQEFPKRLLSAILKAFETQPGLKTCLVTGLWIFYPSVHTSTVLSDLRNRNLKGQVIFLYPGVDQDGISLKLLGLDDGFGYKARRI